MTDLLPIEVNILRSMNTAGATAAILGHRVNTTLASPKRKMKAARDALNRMEKRGLVARVSPPGVEPVLWIRTTDGSLALKAAK